MNTPAPGRGRPRDESIDAAVLAATAQALDEGGYRAVSIEDVARRAGSSKSALYRRWPDRRRLVLAVLEDRLGGSRPPTPAAPCAICTSAWCWSPERSIASVPARSPSSPPRAPAIPSCVRS